jgi:hypothetical protein
MGKTKDKGLKKAKGPELSARPTFEFDLEFEGKASTSHKIDDNDDVRSISSSASKKMMKKMKNILNRSSKKLSNSDLDNRSNHSQIKKKKGSTQPPADTDFFDAGPDDRSTKGGKIKKKKKKGQSVPTLGEKKGGSISNGLDDDMSSRKKKSKKKKKKPKNDDDDDFSVESSRSTRSKKFKKKGGDLLGMSLDVDTSFTDQRRMNDMEIENAALVEETVIIRRQLNEAEKALKKALSEQNPQQANFDQIREVEMAQNEARELKSELEEYEDAVIEKDELIQKLTEAVDAQLDKVELLEVQLVRAEEEFVKMEEEMKEMEDEIEDLRIVSPPGQVKHDNDQNGNSTNDGDKMLDEEILEQLEKREREIEKREQELLDKEDYVLERETMIKQQDEELKRKRSSLLKPQLSFDSSDKEINGHDISIEVDELKAKIIQLEAENNDLSEEIECLRAHDTATIVQDTTLAHQHDEELESLRDSFDKKMEDSKLENEILRQELDDFKQRKNSENEELRQQIEELKKQKTHVEASSRQVRRMESVRMIVPESTITLDIDDGEEEFGLEVEVEIAELREKIVEQEERSRKLKQEIVTHINENVDLKQELQERENELKELEWQLSANKEASAKKMKQKDETITFMQNTMMQTTLEKQELDKKLRGSNLDRTQTKLMNHQGADEEEKAKLEAINTQLRKLDDENRLLEDELNQFKYKSSLQLKEKESAILQLQEELSDVKWELGAREKGADYVTLLKDRKERKDQLIKARKDVKIAEEKILELELQNKEWLSSKKDLEEEIKSLTMNEDVGEQISGLKRQIKSLKQHNTALERKLDTESRDSSDRIREKEAKIRILEFEMEKLRTAPPQTPIRGTAIRGAVSGFITGFGRNDTEVNTDFTSEDDETKSTKTENTDSTAKENGKPAKIWSLFGSKQRPTNRNNGIGNEVNQRESMINSQDGFKDNETL